MKVPTQPWTILYKLNKETIPAAHYFLKEWKKKASVIPNQELREQALDSLSKKYFHCEGGSAFGLLAGQRQNQVIQFMVAYQTICDYLDNLCDQSESLDPNDFRTLHDALDDALTPGAELKNYYYYREEQEDGGYLHSLIETCQNTLRTFPGFPMAQEDMRELSSYYQDLQVYKHVKKEEREPLLKEWYKKHEDVMPDLTWYEFSSATASTLGVYTLAGYAARGEGTPWLFSNIKNAYFPAVQGLHILLDYFIDQEEDHADDELNFINYYGNEDEMVHRMHFFMDKVKTSIERLPDQKFHQLIYQGVIAIYLTDNKVQLNKEMKETAKQIVRFGGLSSRFFYVNSWVFRKIK
ncbi:tetraprenyl-beta-curcumene synthase family protein [Bacillus sp. FJAT-44742]|uniref:tetraprenyl-beta-curcumene synthase family protein n=1 Tax=Bacillus sp. FJAT-44742 TaxID=2014005 RepID=UPI000C23BF8B|nr:tetraprenyl-beta-curcumene synthase family protein [Bacillus sp. FJAT-44742]